MLRTFIPLSLFVAFIGVSLVAVIISPLWGFLGVLLAAGIYGWAVFAFFHYRHVRQEEFLQLLTMTAESEAPLGPALWSYVNDRPHADLREFWTAMLVLFGFMPAFPFYWFWSRRHSFDRKVERVASLVDSGAELHEALGAEPGVLPREAVLAAAVGQSTGKLAACLRSVPRWRLATVWLDVVPRLLYPLFLLLLVTGAVGLFLVFIIPKYERIFSQFHTDLPWFTRDFIDIWRVIFEYAWLLVVGAITVLLLIGALMSSSTACWNVPGFGRLYRMHARSRFLKALGLLLETAMPVPQALAVLYDSGCLPEVVRRRVGTLRGAVERGEPLADQLYRCGLLPRYMLPLVQAALRAQNLPWALDELGESLAKRVSQITYRMTMTIFPLAVAGIGILVGTVAIAMFWPLVQLLSEMAV